MRKLKLFKNLLQQKLRFFIEKIAIFLVYAEDYRKLFPVRIAFKSNGLYGRSKNVSVAEDVFADIDSVFIRFDHVDDVADITSR